MTSDLPPEAEGRLTGPAFSSGLSVNDFAACLHMGLRPVALVQGYCVMGWRFYATGGPYGYYPNPSAYRYGRSFPGGPGRVPGTVGGGIGGPYPRPRFRATGALSSYSCNHYNAGFDHRSMGGNYEQAVQSDAWMRGFDIAFNRMVEEARQAGADGVVGVVDRSSELISSRVREFHIYGTAVAVDTPGRPGPIWTSYLAGQRLAKLMESGFMPVSVVATAAAVRMYSVCYTAAQMRGSSLYGYAGSGSGSVAQFADAQMQARRVARDRAKSVLGSDTLHGVRLETSTREVGEGDAEVTCVMRGTRVRRVRPADPLPPPRITVRLNDPVGP